MRQKYFTTRRLEAFMWDTLVMHAASLNCYCSKYKMSACVSCEGWEFVIMANGRKKGEKLFNNSNTLILLVVSMGILPMILIM